jgi:hypothetical protein
VDYNIIETKFYDTWKPMIKYHILMFSEELYPYYNVICFIGI